METKSVPVIVLETKKDSFIDNGSKPILGSGFDKQTSTGRSCLKRSCAVKVSVSSTLRNFPLRFCGNIA